MRRPPVATAPGDSDIGVTSGSSSEPSRPLQAPETLSRRPDLNREPPDYKSGALPIAPRRRAGLVRREGRAAELAPPSYRAAGGAGARFRPRRATINGEQPCLDLPAYPPEEPREP